MGSDVIVLLTPTQNQGFFFFQGKEDLAIEQLISELAIERLDVAVLPWAAGFDEQGLHPQSCEPSSQLVGNELG